MLFCEMVREIQARKAYIAALCDDQKSKMGIYQIRCLADGRVYVGSTIKIDIEIRNHPHSADHKQVIVTTRRGYSYSCSWAEPFPSEDDVRRAWAEHSKVKGKGGSSIFEPHYS